MTAASSLSLIRNKSDQKKGNQLEIYFSSGNCTETRTTTIIIIKMFLFIECDWASADKAFHILSIKGAIDV